eukprot:2040845-Rhodomonas_salina.1
MIPDRHVPDRSRAPQMGHRQVTDTQGSSQTGHGHQTLSQYRPSKAKPVHPRQRPQRASPGPRQALRDPRRERP